MVMELNDEDCVDGTPATTNIIWRVHIWGGGSGSLEREGATLQHHYCRLLSIVPDRCNL